MQIMWSTFTQTFYERIKQEVDKIIGCPIVPKRESFSFVIKEKGGPQLIYECSRCSYNLAEGSTSRASCDGS